MADLDIASENSGDFSYNPTIFADAMECAEKAAAALTELSKTIRGIKQSKIPSTFSLIDGLNDTLSILNQEGGKIVSIPDQLLTMKAWFDGAIQDGEDLAKTFVAPDTNMDKGDYNWVERSGATAAMIDLKLKEGFGTGVENIVDGALSVVGYIGGLFGAKKLQDGIEEFVEKDYVGDWFTEQYKTGAFASINDASYMDYDNTAANVLKGVGTVGAYIAGTAITGGGALAGLTMFGLGRIGSGTQRGLQEETKFNQFLERMKKGADNAANAEPPKTPTEETPPPPTTPETDGEDNGYGGNGDGGGYGGNGGGNGDGGGYGGNGGGSTPPDTTKDPDKPKEEPVEDKPKDEPVEEKPKEEPIEEKPVEEKPKDESGGEKTVINKYYNSSNNTSKEEENLDIEEDIELKVADDALIDVDWDKDPSEMGKTECPVIEPPKENPPVEKVIEEVKEPVITPVIEVPKSNVNTNNGNGLKTVAIIGAGAAVAGTGYVLAKKAKDKESEDSDNESDNEYKNTSYYTDSINNNTKEDINKYEDVYNN